MTDDGNGKPGGTSENGKAHKRPGREAPRALPKRFYKEVTVEERAPERFAVLLDGRTVRTPAKRELVTPARALTDAIAAEWRAQGEVIDPEAMPLTRLVNTAIDAVSERMGEVSGDIVAFAGSDLICYRAASPDALVRRQSEHWDPILAWAKRELGAEFALREGLMPIAQPRASLERIGHVVSGFDPFTLSATHVMTTISGSALIALAHVIGPLALDAAWQAATVDETWQAEQWGRDAEAEQASLRKRREFATASMLIEKSARSKS